MEPEETLKSVKYWREVERRLRKLAEFVEAGGTYDGFWTDIKQLADEAGKNAAECWTQYEAEMDNKNHSS